MRMFMSVRVNTVQDARSDGQPSWEQEDSDLKEALLNSFQTF